MTKSILLSLVPLLVFVKANADSTIFEYDTGMGWTYRVDSHDIRPGYSSSLIRDGFMLGKIKIDPSKNEMGKNLEDYFQDQVSKIHVDAENRKHSKKLLRQKLENENITELKIESQSYDNSSENNGRAVTPSQLQTYINWDIFDDCAVKMLPLLKKALYFKENPDGLLNADRYFHHIQSLYAYSDKNGMICGDFASSNLNLIFRNEVTYIKFFSALLKLPRDKRQSVFEAFLVSFSSDSPIKSRDLFSFFWARMSWKAISSSASIGSFKDELSQLTQNKHESHIQLSVEKQKSEHLLTIDFDDLKDSYQSGIDFIKKKGLVYE